MPVAFRNSSSFRAYLFAGPDHSLAVTRDPTGANLPPGKQWQLNSEFRLGVDNPVPFASNPEPILLALAADGYYIWHGDRLRHPTGTSQ